MMTLVFCEKLNYVDSGQVNRCLRLFVALLLCNHVLLSLHGFLLGLARRSLPACVSFCRVVDDCGLSLQRHVPTQTLQEVANAGGALGFFGAFAID